jgi:hypothetical protein
VENGHVMLHGLSLGLIVPRIHVLLHDTAQPVVETAAGKLPDWPRTAGCLVAGPYVVPL